MFKWKSLAVGVFILSAMFAGTAIHFYQRGAADTSEKYFAELLAASDRARKAEKKISDLTQASVQLIADKEREYAEREKDQSIRWEAVLAGLPECKLPRDVGVLLNAAAGLSGASPVSKRPAPRSNDATQNTGAGVINNDPLMPVISCSETLSEVRDNYRVCRLNIEKGFAVKDWYDKVRAEYNQPR